MAAKQHLSHEHPLTLSKQEENIERSGGGGRDDDYRSHLRCYGCTGKIIPGLPYYHCEEEQEERCRLFSLHQKCGDMPITINPDFHHFCGGRSLQLSKSPPDISNLNCMLCNGGCYRFTYACSRCKIQINMQCALEQGFEVEASFHQHPVHYAFSLAPDSMCFVCNGDLSLEGGGNGDRYACNSCDFVVHPDCTDVPLVVQSPSHYPDHPLQLTRYNQPVTCRICTQVIDHTKEWVYWCPECSYFCHVYDYSATTRFEEHEHFSHEHPLHLIEEEALDSTTSGDYSTAKECHGCRQKISWGPYYTCAFCKACHLHKLCAELPDKLEHPMHQGCTLSIYEDLEALTPLDRRCGVCRAECIGFAYYCSSCNFGVDILCALKALKLEKDFHPQHPLVLSLTKSSFSCYACDRDHEGISYQCSTICQFWVHEQCASLPIVKHKSTHDHNHDIKLIYSIPEFFYKMDVYCEICGKYMKHHNWAYYCERCRYFTHIYDCSDPHRDGDAVTVDVVDLPLPGELLLGDTRHPMILVADQFELNAIDVTPSFINLVRCSRTWQTFHVDGKDYSGSTFSFHNGNLVMQVTDIDLPHYIKHEGHPHVLKNTIFSNLTRCTACEHSFFGYGYRCTECAFTLDTYCALLPRRLKHRYDKHPFPLTYSAIEGVEEYVCEICEEDVIPKWFYHCVDCDQSMHARCIWKTYIKLERFYKFHLHSCSLTLVPSSKDLPICVICLEQETFGHGFALLCPDCKFMVHLTCTSEDEVEILHNGKEFYEDKVEVSGNDE